MASERTGRPASQSRRGMRRRDFLALVGSGAAAWMTRDLHAAFADAERRPNIIIVLADDLGYHDLGFQGAGDVRTPNIDALAHNGVRFTNGYVSCPVCSPTRAGLMTGRYQQRFGHEFNPGPAQQAAEHFGLPLTEVTIANVLKDGGYATGLVGKWHLGYTAQYHPLRRGFDEFFGFLGGSHSYTDWAVDKANPILRGSEPVVEDEYLTDAFTREAVSFINRHREHPFFLYLPYNAVHGPLQAIPKYLNRSRQIVDQRRRTYAAMLSAMDDGVGAVMNELRKAGIEQDTLVFFFSDNGGPTGVNGSDNSPLGGAKGMVREGGVRVPFVAQWPRKIARGKTFDHPVIALDILPTAAAAAGGKVPTDRVIDGVNLLPYIAGSEAGAPHEELFWRMGQEDAVRRGDWKLIRTNQVQPALYDLSQDVGERVDLAKGNPEVVSSLSQALEKWESQLVAPLWGRAARARGRRRRGAVAAPAR
jgi:arylsulfatase A-like enzyme